MIIWILPSAEATPTKKSELPIMYLFIPNIWVDINMYIHINMYLYIYTYLFSKPGKPWKRGYRNPFFVLTSPDRTIWANLKKTGELKSGHFRKTHCVNPDLLSNRVRYVGSLSCEQTKNWPTGWSNGPSVQMKQLSLPQLTVHWSTTSLFAPLHGTSILWDVPLPKKVTREGSYKQNLTKYVTIKWSLLLGGAEKTHCICCCTWTTTRCCCSSTLPLKPAIVAKRLYARCFHVFSR